MSGPLGGGLRATPVLATPDVDASLAFYRDQLGFGTNGVWGSEEGGPSEFAIMELGAVTIALQRDATGRGRGTEWSAYLYVADVDGSHAAPAARGVVIARPPEDQFYGCRDFDVRDPDGRLLAFGRGLNPSAAGPGLLGGEGA